MFRGHTPCEGNRDDQGNLLYGVIMQGTPLQQKVSVIDTPTALPTSPLSRRKFLFISNNSDEIVYLGNALVGVADGFPLYQHQSILITCEDTVSIYAISTNAAGSDVRILEGA